MNLSIVWVGEYMKTCYVYWYHLAEHTDVFTQGYVGVTRSLTARHNAHLGGYRGGSSILGNAFKKYGSDKIIKTILHTTHTDCAYALENAYRPMKNIGWNIAIGGGLPPDTTGRVDSTEVRAKRSASVKKAKAGKSYPSKFKGISNRYTEEQKALIGSYHKGKIISEEHKKAITEKLSGENNTHARSIYLVHKDDLTNVLSFPCIKTASDSLKIPYQALRGLFQRVDKTKESSLPNRLGWVCLHANDVADPVSAVQTRIQKRSQRLKDIPKKSGKANHKSKSIVLENTEGFSKTFDSINQAAIAIGLSEATLRYHVQQTLIRQTDSGFNTQGWKVKYQEVLE